MGRLRPPNGPSIWGRSVDGGRASPQWIAEAHRYVEADHKRGNVVVTMA